MSERPEIVACMQTHHKDHANTKNDGREELEAQRDQPRRVRLTFARAADVIGAVIDPESNHDTSGNSHLLHADLTDDLISEGTHLLGSKKVLTMAPRISGGAHSALYIGTIMDSEPTPMPAIN